MKRKTLKYLIFLVVVIVGIFAVNIYTSIMDYRDGHARAASEQTGMELDRKDLQEIDKAWDKIDRTMLKKPDSIRTGQMEKKSILGSWKTIDSTDSEMILNSDFSGEIIHQYDTTEIKWIQNENKLLLLYPEKNEKTQILNLDKDFLVLVSSEGEKISYKRK